MAKQPKITEKGLIDLELQKLQDKVNEFQDYLNINKITAQVTKGNDIILGEDDQEKLHKEILVQIKMQDAVFNWLPLLEKLKEKDVAKQETYGDAKIGGHFNK